VNGNEKAKHKNHGEKTLFKEVRRSPLSQLSFYGYDYRYFSSCSLFHFLYCRASPTKLMMMAISGGFAIA
jgi:hypothetical protein